MRFTVSEDTRTSSPLLWAVADELARIDGAATHDLLPAARRLVADALREPPDRAPAPRTSGHRFRHLLDEL